MGRAQAGTTGRAQAGDELVVVPVEPVAEAEPLLVARDQRWGA